MLNSDEKATTEAAARLEKRFKRLVMFFPFLICFSFAYAKL